LRLALCLRFAIKDDEIYLIEVNPRAARTVPFVSKATGAPLAKIAARVMAGQSLAAQGFTKEIIPPFYSVKEVVLPFNKFPGVIKDWQARQTIPAYWRKRCFARPDSRQHRRYDSHDGRAHPERVSRHQALPAKPASYQRKFRPL
jgi:biotin carboxylase